MIYPVDSAIHRINHYPVDSAIGFPILIHWVIYPVDSAIHLFEWPGPGLKTSMDFRVLVWKRVWKNCICLVRNRVRIWRTGRHTPTKNSQEYRAGDDGKREKAGASLLSFLFPSSPARSLFLSPQPPHNIKRPLRRGQHSLTSCRKALLSSAGADRLSILLKHGKWLSKLVFRHAVWLLQGIKIKTSD